MASRIENDLGISLSSNLAALMDGGLDQLYGKPVVTPMSAPKASEGDEKRRRLNEGGPGDAAQVQGQGDGVESATSEAGQRKCEANPFAKASSSRHPLKEPVRPGVIMLSAPAPGLVAPPGPEMFDSKLVPMAVAPPGKVAVSTAATSPVLAATSSAKAGLVPIAAAPSAPGDVAAPPATTNSGQCTDLAVAVAPGMNSADLNVFEGVDLSVFGVQTSDRDISAALGVQSNGIDLSAFGVQTEPSREQSGQDDANAALILQAYQQAHDEAYRQAIMALYVQQAHIATESQQEEATASSTADKEGKGKGKRGKRDKDKDKDAGPVEKSPIPCKYFREGDCRKGDRCPYNHGEIKPPPCNFFFLGKCTKGAECPMSHEGKAPPCRHFSEKGWCAKGDSCCFSHEGPANVEDAAEKAQLIEKVKQLQRDNPEINDVWRAFCQACGRNVADPSKHRAVFLRHFLTAIQTKQDPVATAAEAGIALTIPGVGEDAEKVLVVEHLKQLQRDSPKVNDYWRNYCAVVGKQTCDPYKYETAFLQHFLVAMFRGEDPVASFPKPGQTDADATATNSAAATAALLLAATNAAANAAANAATTAAPAAVGSFSQFVLPQVTPLADSSRKAAMLAKGTM